MVSEQFKATVRRQIDDVEKTKKTLELERQQREARLRRNQERAFSLIDEIHAHLGEISAASEKTLVYLDRHVDQQQRKTTFVVHWSGPMVSAVDIPRALIVSVHLETGSITLGWQINRKSDVLDIEYIDAEDFTLERLEQASLKLGNYRLWQSGTPKP